MKQTQNQYYGLLREKPGVLPEGSTFISTDTKEVFLYDGVVGGSPISAAGGSGGSFVVASSTDINTGTDNVKGITSLSLQGSNLRSEVTVNNAKVSDVAHPLVEEAVPVGALFTDTIYTDSDTESYIKANATSSTKEVLAIVAGFVSWIGTESNLYELTLTGDCTLENPSAPIDGAGYTFRIKQDGTGSHTLSYGTNWKFPGGIAPAITLDPNAKDYVSVIMDGIELDSVPLQNML